MSFNDFSLYTLLVVLASLVSVWCGWLHIFKDERPLGFREFSNERVHRSDREGVPTSALKARIVDQYGLFVAIAVGAGFSHAVPDWRIDLGDFTVTLPALWPLAVVAGHYASDFFQHQSHYRRFGRLVDQVPGWRTAPYLAGSAGLSILVGLPSWTDHPAGFAIAFVLGGSLVPLTHLHASMVTARARRRRIAFHRDDRR